MLKDLVYVQICKMVESSGNEQFFVRLRKFKESNDILDLSGILEYHCFQTMWQRELKRTKEECLQQAWFSASMLSKFINTKKEDVVFTNMSDEEVEYTKQQLWLRG